MSNIADRHMTDKKGLAPAAVAMVITCEHGGNQIPPQYRHIFRNCRTLLESHRGFDPGALTMARALARNFDAPLLSSTVSRLLVDLNRSIGHQSLHMEAIRMLPVAVRQEILEHYYQPYRTEAERLVTQGVVRCGRVVHISCHSFTDNFNGVVRHADIGLLYDPARHAESSLCSSWKSVLKALSPDLEVRRNFPYLGRNDGLTSAMRKKFPDDVYVGIELELNQKKLRLPARQWAAMRESVITSLDTVLRAPKHSVRAAQ